ncbi:MAG: hypothetical protein GX666_12470, partial [Tissierellia bacterium]|nr:hypothetical protein [Tissierellia bacterium]
KPNGNLFTTLTKDAIYTVRWNGVNFILQGEGASGNATASDLLSGKTATTDAGEITGTMPNRGAVSHSLTINGTYTIPEGYHNGSGQVTQSIPTKGAATITPSTTDQIIAAGQYLAGSQIIQGSPNFIEQNIRKGVNMWGKIGTYEGDYTFTISSAPILQYQSTTSAYLSSSTTTDWVLMKEAQIKKAGTVRLEATAYHSGGGTMTKLMFRKNGVNLTWELQISSTEQTFSVDSVAVNPNDLLQVWAKTFTGYLNVTSFSILFATNFSPALVTFTK